MPLSRGELYSAGRQELLEAWRRTQETDEAFPAEGEADFAAVLSGPELAPRYALVTQLVLKLVIPTAGIRQLKDFQDAPSGFSARALAKNTVVPFDIENDALLGGSADPYVSNPLRRESIDESLSEEDRSGQWAALIRVLDRASESSHEVRAALVSGLRGAKARQLTLVELLGDGMELQMQRAAGEEVTEVGTSYSSDEGLRF